MEQWKQRMLGNKRVLGEQEEQGLPVQWPGLSVSMRPVPIYPTPSLGFSKLSSFCEEFSRKVQNNHATSFLLIVQTYHYHVTPQTSNTLVLSCPSPPLGPHRPHDMSVVSTLENQFDSFFPPCRCCDSSSWTSLWRTPMLCSVLTAVLCSVLSAILWITAWSWVQNLQISKGRTYMLVTVQENSLFKK